MQKLKISLRLGVLLILLFLSIVAWFIYALMPHRNILETVGQTTNPHLKYFSILDGRAVESLEEEKPLVVAVMIDNFPGISQFCLGGVGGVVYEAPVEGATTRFMQVMSASSTVPKIGPVRSARAYYLDWLAEYGDDALYMHCGGAPEALSLIKSRNIFDANEFYWGSFYWRDQQKTAPHNLFTGQEKWASLLDKHRDARHASVWSGWEFSESVPGDSGESITEISIKYFPGYKVTWRYRNGATSSFYERLVNGDYHHSICSLDPSTPTAPISAQNIIIQFAQMETIDEVGRKEIVTIGAGDAYVLRNGLLVRATWKKENMVNRTRFYNEQNQEIKLAPGSTWVQIVPIGTTVDITN